MPKGTVLVIDDEESIRESFKMIFEFEGYRLLLAASGEEGLGLAEGEDPDIIFLDVKLPGIDGLSGAGKADRAPRQGAGGDDLRARHNRHRGLGDQDGRLQLPREAA